jgi:asparagine synthase (glutamine-hydrolysing)
MCGIAGIVTTDGDVRDSRDTVGRMVSLLHHRGPDATGMYDDSHAILGHARLSIIDLEGGSQPVHNEDSSVWVVFNG